MWQLLPIRLQLVIVAAASVLGWETVRSLLYLLGGSAPDFLHYSSLAASTALAIGVPLVNHAWPSVIKNLQSLETLTFPNLNGRWHGTYQSDWIDPATGVQIGPREIAIDICLSLFSVSVAMKSMESRLHSTWCRLEPNRQSRIFRVRYLFENEPDARVADRSAMHEGICWSEFRPNESNNRLVGQYYNYRGRRGDVDLHRDLLTKPV